jgi:hypothetical protein
MGAGVADGGFVAVLCVVAPDQCAVDRAVHPDQLWLGPALEKTGEARPAFARTILVAGIVFNLCFLGYFKYLNFAASAMNDAFGTGFVLTQLILPLGISFITFQKIAFLVDVQAGRVSRFSLADYALVGLSCL